MDGLVEESCGMGDEGRIVPSEGGVPKNLQLNQRRPKIT